MTAHITQQGDGAFEHLPPHSIDAEMCLLGAFMLAEDRVVRDEIVERLKPGAFFLPDHQTIFAALASLHRTGKPIDAVILRDELKRAGTLEKIGSTAYLAQILGAVPSSAHAREYLERVFAHWATRRIIQLGDGMVRAGMTGQTDPLALARDAHTRLGRFIEQATLNAPPISPADELATHIDDTIAGRHACLPFPWPALSELSQALRPGTMTVIAGGVGDSKSLKLLQALTFLIQKGVPTSAFLLEDDRSFHLYRILAQITGRSEVTNLEWVAKNGKAAQQLFVENADLLDKIGSRIWDAPKRIPTLAEVATWVRQRADAGDRVITVDPITRAKTSDRRFADDEEFVAQIAATAHDKGASVILITHPSKTAKGKPTLGDLAGGAAYSRFAQCVLFMRKLEPAKRVRCVDHQYGATYDTTANRELMVMKARSGAGTGKSIAFTFETSSLTFVERGVITRYQDEPADAESADA